MSNKNNKGTEKSAEKEKASIFFKSAITQFIQTELNSMTGGCYELARRIGPGMTGQKVYRWSLMSNESVPSILDLALLAKYKSMSIADFMVKCLGCDTDKQARTEGEVIEFLNTMNSAQLSRYLRTITEILELRLAEQPSVTLSYKQAKFWGKRAKRAIDLKGITLKAASEAYNLPLPLLSTLVLSPATMVLKQGDLEKITTLCSDYYEDDDDNLENIPLLGSKVPAVAK